MQNKIMHTVCLKRKRNNISILRMIMVMQYKIHALISPENKDNSAIPKSFTRTLVLYYPRMSLMRYFRQSNYL